MQQPAYPVVRMVIPITDRMQYPPMPIKAKPYQHQRAAFEFACRMFGLCDGDNDEAARHPNNQPNPEGGDMKCQKKPHDPEASPF